MNSLLGALQSVGAMLFALYVVAWVALVGGALTLIAFVQWAATHGKGVSR